MHLAARDSRAPRGAAWPADTPCGSIAPTSRAVCAHGPGRSPPGSSEPRTELVSATRTPSSLVQCRVPASASSGRSLLYLVVRGVGPLGFRNEDASLEQLELDAQTPVRGLALIALFEQGGDLLGVGSAIGTLGGEGRLELRHARVENRCARDLSIPSRQNRPVASVHVPCPRARRLRLRLDVDAIKQIVHSALIDCDARGARLAITIVASSCFLGMSPTRSRRARPRAPDPNELHSSRLRWGHRRCRGHRRLRAQAARPEPGGASTRRARPRTRARASSVGHWFVGDRTEPSAGSARGQGKGDAFGRARVSGFRSREPRSNVPKMPAGS